MVFIFIMSTILAMFWTDNLQCDQRIYYSRWMCLIKSSKCFMSSSVHVSSSDKTFTYLLGQKRTLLDSYWFVIVFLQNKTNAFSVYDRYYMYQSKGMHSPLSKHKEGCAFLLSFERISNTINYHQYNGGRIVLRNTLLLYDY